MNSLAGSDFRGRVLVLGGGASAESLLASLTDEGFAAAAASADNVLAVANNLRPEAVVLTAPAGDSARALGLLRGASRYQDLPALADFSSGPQEPLRALGVVDVVRSLDELATRIEASLRAQRAVASELRARQRLETLLEITQAATSSLELDQVLSIAVEKISQIIPSDRCSVILVEGDGPRMAWVVASRELPGGKPFQLDLARYPELRRALETRQPVHVEDAFSDRLMSEVRPWIEPLGVRSVLVQPVISQDEMLGALFLRMSKADDSFGREEREFAQAVAASLANSIRNARLHGALRRKREDLESAYVDRYRELAEANRRLKELNRLKDEIIAVCSHDLRAPLQVLLGHGRLLLDGNLTPQQVSSVEAMNRMGRKILELVESLLERGRGDRARMTLDARLVDVSEVCKEATHELEILATQRGVTLRAETPESLMAVGDELKLRQVLQNLVTNAIHHAGDAGEVVVRAQRLKRPDGDAVRVSVQDDGQGMSEQQLRTVFDRYHAGKDGVGLGLTICKDFVELHGGEIWAQPSAGKGVTFVFTLPLAKDRAAAPAPVPDARRQPRVLVMEDEPEVASEISELLRSRYRVDVARDGEEGVARAKADRPDLIVMDVFLPKLDGLDAVAILKGSPDTADIPIVLLSAHQAVSDKLRALDLGAIDYLGKPFQGMELLNVADRALRLRDAELELHRSRSLLRRTGNDPETGLFDRSGILTRLDQEISRARRYARPLCAAVLYPQNASAQQIRAFASEVRRQLRVPDVVGHLGGGLLAVILPESQVDTARQLLHRMEPEVEQVSSAHFNAAVLDLSSFEGTAERALEELLGKLPK